MDAQKDQIAHHRATLTYESAPITEHQISQIEWFTSPKIKLVQVAQPKVKYMQDFKHVRQFFMDIQGNTLNMSQYLVQWNTGRLMETKIHKLKFLEYFEMFNPYIRSLYRDIMTAYGKYQKFPGYSQFGMETEAVQSLTEYLDNVSKFQIFVQDNSEDTEAIATMAKMLLNSAPGLDIKAANAIDMSLYNQFLQLLDWVESVEVLLNQVQPDAFKNLNVESELRSFIHSKSADILLTYKPAQ
jgi:hypothetical protein